MVVAFYHRGERPAAKKAVRDRGAVDRGDRLDGGVGCLDMIGTRSDLDVDGVIALCDKVIDAAWLDLRGRYGND